MQHPPSVAPTPQPGNDVPSPEVVCAILEQVNSLRADQDLSALRLDGRLQEAAYKHSEDMAVRNYFSHVSPDGKGVDDRVIAEGYPWSTIAENIAVGYTTAESVVRGWRDSPGHYKNILCSDCVDTGIGVYYDANSKWKYYYTQVFGATRDVGEVPRIECSKISTPDRDCTTVGGPSPFQQCAIPFTYLGLERSTCIRERDATQAWCPTTAGAMEAPQNNNSDWGYCGKACSVTVVECRPHQWWCTDAREYGQVSENEIIMHSPIPNITIVDEETRCCSQALAVDTKDDRTSLALGLGIGLPLIGVVVGGVVYRMRNNMPVPSEG